MRLSISANDHCQIPCFHKVLLSSSKRLILWMFISFSDARNSGSVSESDVLLVPDLEELRFRVTFDFLVEAFIEVNSIDDKAAFPLRVVFDSPVEVFLEVKFTDDSAVFLFRVEFDFPVEVFLEVKTIDGNALFFLLRVALMSDVFISFQDCDVFAFICALIDVRVCVIICTA